MLGGGDLINNTGMDIQNQVNHVFMSYFMFNDRTHSIQLSLVQEIKVFYNQLPFSLTVDHPLSW